MYASRARTSHTKASEELWSQKQDARAGTVTLKCTKVLKACAELVASPAARSGARVTEQEVAHRRWPAPLTHDSMSVGLKEELLQSFLTWVLAVQREYAFRSIPSALGFPGQHLTLRLQCFLCLGYRPLILRTRIRKHIVGSYLILSFNLLSVINILSSI